MDELICTPYAVGHSDEGVCLGLKLGPYRILLDCGLANIAPLTAPSTQSPQPTTAPANFVICSHAHTDHARGLLALNQAFPTLPIYSSEATAELLPLNWPHQKDLVPFWIGLPWRHPIALATDLNLELWPAGHLPGAACALLTYRTQQQTYRVLYTGDCFLSPTRLVEGLPLELLRGLQPDVLIIDGTDGTTRHRHRRQQENELAERLRHRLETHPDRYMVLPAPLLGLGQELLMLLRSHHHLTGYPTTIWVDPLIAQGCDAYLNILDTFPRSVQNFAQHQPLFWDERVFPRVKRLIPGQPLPPPPAILVVHPATPPPLYSPPPSTAEWTVFLPATVDLEHWQAQVPQQGTAYNWLDALKNTAQSGTVQLETYDLSFHCDGLSTTQLIHNLRPQHVLLVHGTPNHLTDLANLEDLQNRYQIRIPLPGHPIELLLDQPFWQPAPPPATTYEGAVIETQESLTIALPPEIAQDPRWAAFADTGLIELTWQGDKLVLQGLSQADMLLPVPSQTQNCFHCHHQRQQYCRNPASPLFNRQVTPDGYCPEFSASETLSGR
ncbi:MAG: MBL fold metallo-hydrolase [Cyanobacteria bacterium P01_F01_bin.4]